MMVAWTASQNVRAGFSEIHIEAVAHLLELGLARGVRAPLGLAWQAWA